MNQFPLLIGGRERKEGPPQPVLDKYDGSVVGEVFHADMPALQDAIACASRARMAMAELPAHERSRIILDARSRLESKKSDLGEVICREAGKPIKYARGEVDRCLENLAFAAGEALRVHGETVPVDASTAGDGRSGYFERHPIGVVAAISPFNFPLNLAAHKVAPAVAAGCPVILKPAGLTPISGIELSVHLWKQVFRKAASALSPDPGPPWENNWSSTPMWPRSVSPAAGLWVNT